MVRDIPGFYFDAAKKRYFKVQPNHAASGQQHSAQAIQVEESAAKKLKLTHEHQCRQKREAVSRSRISTHPLLGRIAVGQRIAERSTARASRYPADDVASFYASTLSRKKRIYACQARVPTFEVDKMNGSVIFAHSSYGPINDSLQCLPLGRYGHCGSSYFFEFMADPCVDMSLSPSLQRLFYITVGPEGTWVCLVGAPRDEHDTEQHDMRQTWHFRAETGWQTAASPVQGDSFALASSRAVRIFKMKPDRILTMPWSSAKESPNGDYTTVAFGMNDRTILGGTRMGLTCIFDERTRDSVVRLKHPDAVSAIKMADEGRVIVRGLTKMSLYDLRYTKAPSCYDSNYTIATNPYREFPWASTSASFKEGFDYNSELGIIATGSTKVFPNFVSSYRPQTRAEVNLFSVRTGRQLDSNISSLHDSNPFACVKFARGLRSHFKPGSELRRHDNEAISLFASQSGIISEWYCQGDGLRDEDLALQSHYENALPEPCASVRISYV